MLEKKLKDKDYVSKSPKPETFLREKNYSHHLGTHYCPGCGHGLVNKFIGEVVDEYNIRDKTIMVASVGCAVFDFWYYDCDRIQVPHGRSPAVATGLKRARPECVVITHQGDGDLAAIGTAETIHAANRGENISIFFVNNAIYGMTGGQMAPTTLEGQKSTTSPGGRNVQEVGYPIKVCELLNTLIAPTYIERVALYDMNHVRRAKEAVKKSIRIQLKNQGFSLVEFLSPCPTNWGMSVKDALEFTKKNMEKYYPLGIFRDLEDKK